MSEKTKEIVKKRMCKMVVVKNTITGVTHRLPAKNWFKDYTITLPSGQKKFIKASHRNQRDLVFIKDIEVEYPSKLNKK